MSPSNGIGETDFFAIVIGAGFSGLAMGIKLAEEGIDSFVILERADEVGGTWRDNSYPGAGCDVHSHLYSYSFEQNPDWSRTYGAQPEIQDYILRVTGKYRLRPKIRFGAEVVAARFDDDTGVWTVRIASGEELTARVVISAAGGLTNPAIPDFEGLDTFEGRVFHTARWDHDYDLSGKRIGMIGTGASAIQVGPAIAPVVSHLTVFQRTPPWIIEKPDHAVPGFVRAAFRWFPPLLWLWRTLLYWRYEATAPLIIRDTPWMKRLVQKLALHQMKKHIPDPELRRRLRPDYAIGCKRILLSNDWYPMLRRENVSLVTEGIERITPRGVVTRDGTEHELDAIVTATGFHVSISESPFDVRGRNGLSLSEAWKNGAEAYKGVAVSGFPNFFLLLGPNTGPGHTSVLLYTEKQIDYALQAIRMLRGEHLRFVDLRREVQDAFNERLQERMKHTAWTSGCRSWYLTEDGRNLTLYPGLNAEYRLSVSRFEPREYELVA